jgi:hypothetical protein
VAATILRVNGATERLFPDAQNMRGVMRENASRLGAAERPVYRYFVRDRPALSAKSMQKSTSWAVIAFYRGVLSF